MKRLRRLLLSGAIVATAIWAVSPAVSYSGGNNGHGNKPPHKSDETSINSTSVNADALPSKPVSEQSIVANKSYTVIGINDLGMHCGDLDTRLASILPPYNVLHAMVLQKGPQPHIVRLPDDNISVYYSAASSKWDIVFDPTNPQPAGFDMVGGGGAFKGVYKTNWWDDALNLGAYNPFYPIDFSAVLPIPLDKGLVVPDPALLPSLDVVAQEAMPGILGPYVRNDAQKFARFDTALPFFTSFQFGYTTGNLRWFGADGIPVTTFDDSGRVNPYPLMRVSARDNKTGRLLATVDTVTPVSGEANCRLCHTNNDPANGGVGGYTASAQGVSLDYTTSTNGVVNPGNMATAMDDPQYGEVPLAVSVEYAQDLNVLRYHDRTFGTQGTGNNSNRGYRDSAGVLHNCKISRWKYQPAAGFNNSNATPILEANGNPIPEDTYPNGDQNCLTNKAMVLDAEGKTTHPVVCQTCHYTPALDLTQVGPIGGAPKIVDAGGAVVSPGYDDGTQNGGLIDCPTGTGGADPIYGNCVANGRAQRNKGSMSRAVHNRHKGFSDTFPMPSPDNIGDAVTPKTRAYIVQGGNDPNCNTATDPNDTTTRTYAQCEACKDKAYAECVVENTCYNCHPGKYTKCLRGTMGANGMLCQDCHGSLAQVSNDFSQGLSFTKPFPGGADLTKRVPWASEPGCQSCHVGDAVNQPADTTGFIYSDEGVRLIQAWKKGDTNAAPIASTNSRFAEDQFVYTDPEDATKDRNNRILYRLSRGSRTITLDTSGSTMRTGHHGVFCEACHGPTHAEWPVTPNYEGAWPPPDKTFVANDNATAGQLQGHTGKIIECDTCHTGDYNLEDALGGPHGLHPVGGTDTKKDRGYSQWWVNNHGTYLGQNPTAETLRDSCGVCHGAKGEGTVLSEVAIDRVVEVPDFVSKNKKLKVKKGNVTLHREDMVSCGTCHANPFGPQSSSSLVVTSK